MKITITTKLIALMLVCVIALPLLAGCKSENDPESTGGEDTAPVYTVTPIVDEESTTDVPNDAVTIAIEKNSYTDHKKIDGYNNCESHFVIAHTYTDGADAFDALVYRLPIGIYDPATGNNEYYPEDNVYCLIAFEKADGDYDSVNYGEYETLDAALDASAGAFTDVSFDENGAFEATPYRFVKEGKIYLIDKERYVTYADNLIAEILSADNPTGSYKAYVKNSKETYDKLFDINNITDYVLNNFLAGEKDSPKAFVLYRVLKDILSENDETFDYKLEDDKKAQLYFENFLGRAKEMRHQDGIVLTAVSLPTWCRLIELYHETLSNDDFLKELFILPCPSSIKVYNGADVVEYTYDDEKYFDILRESVNLYIPSDSLAEYKKNVSPKTTVTSLYRKGTLPSNIYFEYVYNNGTTPNYVFSADGSIMFEPVEGSNGKYTAYDLMVSSHELVDILESLFK